MFRQDPRFAIYHNAKGDQATTIKSETSTNLPDFISSAVADSCIFLAAGIAELVAREIAVQLVILLVRHAEADSEIDVSVLDPGCRASWSRGYINGQLVEEHVRE